MVLITTHIFGIVLLDHEAQILENQEYGTDFLSIEDKHDFWKESKVIQDKNESSKNIFWLWLPPRR